jgi:hypothetical protein
LQENRTVELTRKIFRSAVLVLFPLAAASAFLEWEKLPLSILAGGLLGFLNVKGLAWSVEGLLGTHRASRRMVIFSLFRLLILFAILSLLVYLRLVNIFGVLAGLTVIFALIITEGLKYAKKMTAGEPDSD